MIRHLSTKVTDDRRSEMGGGPARKLGEVCICGVCRECRVSLKEAEQQ